MKPVIIVLTKILGWVLVFILIIAMGVSVMAWLDLKNKLGIGRKFHNMELFVAGIKVNLKTFEFKKGLHYHTLNGELVTYDLVEVKFYWRKNGQERTETLYIEAGTIWDGASIPKLFRKLIGNPLDPEFALASLIHDFAVKRFPPLHHYAESRMFYEVLKSQKGRMNLPVWKEHVMYVSVYAWSLYTA